jgi:hypothetical protein
MRLIWDTLSGNWLNMAASLKRILVRRALAGQHPVRAQQLIGWLEHTVTGWNRHSTPFVWNAHADDDASGHACAASAALERRFDMATELPPDPLA